MEAAQEDPGSYELLEALGTVPWGKAWRAVDRHSGEAVVLKRIPHATLAAAVQSAAGASLVEEARALTRIARPGLPVVYEVRETDEELLLIFDPPPSRDLLSGFDTGFGGEPSLDRPALVEWGSELLELLAEVHAMGALHRHLGLGSVSLREGGRLALWGFGLTRLAEDPSFLPPPELLRGLPALPASDLFSLASILETLAVRGTEALLGSPQEDPLAEVLARAQAIEPSLRFADAAEMEWNLRQAGMTAAVPLPDSAPAPEVSATRAEPGAARKRRGALWAALTMVGVVAAAGLGLRWLSLSPVRSPIEASPAAAVQAGESTDPAAPQETGPPPPPTPEQILARAQRLLEQGDDTAAEELLERLLTEGEPINPVPLLDLLGTLRLESGRSGEAIGLLERAVALAPSVELHYKLGLALTAEGRPAEALEQFQAARELDPAAPEILEAIETLGGLP